MVTYIDINWYASEYESSPLERMWDWYAGELSVSFGERIPISVAASRMSITGA